MINPIRPAVRAAFRAYSEKHEGRTRNPYADVRGFVTVSVGCILEPIESALRLDWRIGDRAATQAEVRDDWQAVKDLGKRWDKPWTAERQAALTSIRLTDDGVDALLRSRLNANADWLARRLLPEFPDFPADAQLGILSVAWAIGCDFRHTSPPRHELVTAISARDWLAAKAHAKLRERGNPGVIGRNRDQDRCFDNAAIVERNKLDPAILHWPATVIPPVDP